MATRKSQRSRKATVAFEDRSTASAASAPKLTSKTARNNLKTALKPVAVELLPELDHGPLSKLPDYRPSFDLRLLASESTATGLSELQTFKKLYSQEVVDTIIAAINNYIENARKTAEEFNYARRWESINSTDI
jgi:hypothetical protein